MVNEQKLEREYRKMSFDDLVTLAINLRTHIDIQQDEIALIKKTLMRYGHYDF